MGQIKHLNVAINGQLYSYFGFLFQHHQKSSHHSNEDEVGPYFDQKSPAVNVTAVLGKTAQLACRVHGLGNKTVWQNIICTIIFIHTRI